ncbi:MAG: type III-B CRISPR module-associated protein Cmr5 [Porphyromonadaceae bacterium]|nr:type III-B CRISPR module-associated protein Cmr5 [Porphyromonadaceae bacterium]
MIINKQEIQQLIPTAIKAIETIGIANTEGEVSKVNEGYINAMGPSIIQSGLLPTLIFYNKSKKEGNNTEGEPRLWLRALYYMHLPEEQREEINWRELAPTTLIKEIIAGQGGSLERIAERANIKDWEGKTLKYIVALKLALRTFVIKDKKDNEEGGDE